ncbi:MAG: D-alanyl-D-alanine carboxypeptidase family protein [Acidimicrobiia bacterium]|nr:D-alanyl-D-alanine carboxypeptidase family protein [Acidimicrobiia bacterium]
MRLRVWLIVVGLMVSALPALAVNGHRPLPEYSGPEFQALYEFAVANTLPNLEPPNGRYEVTGNEELDSRIWQIAIDRGYELRASASGDLVRADGVWMQPQAAEAWQALKDEARSAGMRFIVSSAYRSPETQRQWFLSMLSGTSESEINATLDWYSLPGTSKHHSGYALDFRYADDTFGGFRATPDYAWLSADNFAIPKRHGFVPSYPDDGLSQGPRPEPWEFVWVGLDLIECGLPQHSGSSIGGPASALVLEIERCPGGPAPVALPLWLDH